MKMNIATRYALVTGLLLGAASTASAIQATYQVNMGVQIALGNFRPGTDTIFVSGSFSSPSWVSTSAASAYELTPSGGDPNVYVGTFSIVNGTGSYENHKFVINPNNSFSALNWENVTGGGNRFFQVAATNMVLPVVFFGDQTNVPSTTVPVTFQVDMGTQMTLGHFDPNAGDYVIAAGNFNVVAGTSTWATDFVLTNVTGGTVYANTFEVTNLSPGATLTYKFVIDGATWESRANRTNTLASTNQTLPVVFFNDVTNVPATPTPLNFQVNMAAQIALGGFDPNVDYVVVAGGYNAWGVSSAYALAPSSTNANLYVGTFSDSLEAPGNASEYQYVIDGTRWETAVGNRGFTLASTNQTLPMVYWNNVSDLGSLVLNSLSGGKASLHWDSGTNVGSRIRLQTSTNLALGGWTDVAGTEGITDTNLPVSGRQTFFRLVGP